MSAAGSASLETMTTSAFGGSTVACNVANDWKSARDSTSTFVLLALMSIQISYGAQLVPPRIASASSRRSVRVEFANRTSTSSSSGPPAMYASRIPGFTLVCRTATRKLGLCSIHSPAKVSASCVLSSPSRAPAAAWRSNSRRASATVPPCMATYSRASAFAASWPSTTSPATLPPAVASAGMTAPEPSMSTRNATRRAGTLDRRMVGQPPPDLGPKLLRRRGAVNAHPTTSVVAPAAGRRFVSLNDEAASSSGCRARLPRSVIPAFPTA